MVSFAQEFFSVPTCDLCMHLLCQRQKLCIACISGVQNDPKPHKHMRWSDLRTAQVNSVGSHSSLRLERLTGV